MGNRGSILHENRTICIGGGQNTKTRSHFLAENGAEDDVKVKPSKQRVFCDNRVVSYKYTVWSFLPRNLFEQFRRIANFYFLCITIIQLTIDSPVSATTSILPLAFVILVTAVKQGYEDWLRHRADAKVNKAPSSVLDARGNRKAVECSHLMVGDIVRVEDGEDLPCDLILLASSRRDGKAHVTTANLDGETNLKTLQCPKPLRFIGNSDIESQLANLQVKIVCEEPTADLYNFSGTLEILNQHKITKINSDAVRTGSTKEDRRNSQKASLKSKFTSEPKVSLSIDNLLLRGARLKNTEFVYGCAIYTGQETKLSLNSKLTRNKFSSVEKAVNGFLFFFLVIMAIEVVVSIALKLVIEQDYTSVNKMFMEEKRKITTESVVQDVFSFIILYNYLIPISLYVTIELQKFLGTFFFTWDSDMYCDKTKQAAVCNTSDLNEELGQVQYLFTDKTGTLTENMMEFQRCSINGMTFVENNGKLKRLLADGREENGIDIINLTPEIEEFFIALALCHTAQVEKWKLGGPPGNSVKSNGKRMNFSDGSLDTQETEEEEEDDDEDMTTRDPMKLNYQASSPDEKALLEAIRRCRVAYLGEKDDILYVKVKERVRMFLRLDVLEFSSERSRMSIAVEEVFNDERSGNCDDYPVIVYCKGAESVLEKLSVKGPKQETINHIDDFAKRGLRTLMVGRRHLTKKEFATLSAAIQADRLHQAVAGTKKTSVIGSIRELPTLNGQPFSANIQSHSRNFSSGGGIETASGRTSSLKKGLQDQSVTNRNSHDVHFKINPTFVGDNGITIDYSNGGNLNGGVNSFHNNPFTSVQNRTSFQSENANKNGFHTEGCGKVSSLAMSEISKNVCECEKDSVPVKDGKTGCGCKSANNFSELDKSLQERKASLDSAIKINTSARKKEAMHHLRSKSSSDYRHFYGIKQDSVLDMAQKGNLRERAVSGSILRRFLSRQNSLLSSISNSDSIKSFPMIRRDSGLRDSDALLALESGLTVLGATAVRDQLQEKVPETLESLRAAGIKIWILTGDKVETAVNVSFSCGHFKIGTEQLFLTGHSKHESCFQALNNFSQRIESDREKQYGLVIDGMSLHQIFYEDNDVDPQIAIDKFLSISSSCTAVICCRMSPLQKCKVVQLVKNLHQKPITAAIGDGANDVSMIQEAHVGIGIMGKEGRQAARSSDFCFARFHFLRKALLVHGHWYYVRLATLIQYFFYKNMVFNTPQMCYGAHSLFSTQTLYDGLYLTTYNVLMTSLPVTLFGLFEQNYSAKLLMKYPHLYLINRGNSLMLWRKFFQWIFIGLWHSLALYFAVWAIWFSNGSILPDGGPADFWCFGTTIFHIVVVVVNLKIWLESKFWTSLFIFSILISIFGNMILTYFYSIVSIEFDMFGVYLEMLQSPCFWLLSTIISVACLLPDVVIMVLKDPIRLMWKQFQKRRTNGVHFEVSSFWKKNSGSLTISNTMLADHDVFG